MGEGAMPAGGEMRRRVGDKDWSATPLGPASGWSASLRQAVELVLGSAFPMALRWGPDLVVIYNDAYAPILGDKHPGALGAPLCAVWPEIWDELGPLNTAILRGERAGFFARAQPWRIRRHGERWENARFAIGYSPVPDATAEGGIGGVLATALETTEQVDREQRLQRHTEDLEEENRKRVVERDRIWELSEDLLGVSNFAGYFTSVNPAWSRLLGWSADEIGRMHVSELRHPDDAAEANEQRARLAQGVPTVRMQNRFRHKDGSWRWLHWTLSAEHDAIYVIGRDVSNEKQAVERLAESERLLRLFVGSVTDYALFRIDADGIISSWNAGAERIKGYRADEIIGRHYSQFYTPEDRAAGLPQRALRLARETGKYEAEGWRVRQDGSRFWASVVLDAMHDEAGAFIGYAKITRDVTERREAQLALQRTQEQLAQSQKMEAVGQLTGGVAHDFNNLLTIVVGNLELAQRSAASLRDSAAGRLGGLIGNALRGAQRATTLTQRLLAFSRRQPLKPRQLELTRFLIGAAEFLQRSLGEKIEIKQVAGAGLWSVEVDPGELESALLNLALNARDAMPDGGKLTIEAGNALLDEDDCRGTPELQPGRYVMIAVSDTGTGMSAEVQARAIEPFFTTKDVGEGTGLGLSQVYGFVRQSGGHLRIYSEEGQGTTVKIYLPRAAAGAVPEPPPPAPSGDLRGQGETVLLVEDDADVRAYLIETLRELGYRVLAAREAAGALAWLERRDIAIDMLLTDVVLPGRNGRQVAEEAQRLRPGLQVLFMTGYARNAIVHHGRLDAGVELIQKPVAPEALARRIRRLLDLPARASGQ
ncbi:MAG TPA: PAS domain S-box protein [Xanthobacteraceae bacterium]|jgi:PAS domain S-box-containing protein